MKMKAIGSWPILMALLCASFGCGSKTATWPLSNQCGGTLLHGVVTDSLTGSPVAGAKVVLETGSKLFITPIYTFSPDASDTTDEQGGFSVCYNTIATPAVLVFEALDPSGNAYPPTIAPVLLVSNLGTVSLGACHVACGFPGQAQSSAPAGISGLVTTSPIGESGTLSAQTAIAALDGSKNIWNIAIEGLLTGQPDTFLSTAGTCPTTGQTCALYTYTLPSQAPVDLVAGVYKQQEAPPTYSISATPETGAGCTQPFLSTSFQSNGSSPLTAVPGKQLTVADLSFTGCH